MCCCCCSDCILVLLALLFPPLPVWIKRGFCSTDAFINIILTLLGYIPGLIHSFYIISKYPLDGILIVDEERGQVYARDSQGGVRVVRLNHNHTHAANAPVAAITAAGAASASSTNTPIIQNNTRTYGAIEPPAYAEFEGRVSEPASGKS